MQLKILSILPTHIADSKTVCRLDSLQPGLGRSQRSSRLQLYSRWTRAKSTIINLQTSIYEPIQGWIQQPAIIRHRAPVRAKSAPAQQGRGSQHSNLAADLSTPLRSLCFKGTRLSQFGVDLSSTMSKNHFVGLTSHPTTARANTRWAQRNKGNQQEHGTSAEVNGSIIPGHDPDDRPTTVPSDSSLPNGHEPVVFGSASHEPGMSHRVKDRHSSSPTVNGGSSATLAARTQMTDRDNDTNREDTDIVETHLAGGELMDETRPTYQLPASLQPDPRSVSSLDHRTYALSYWKQWICPRLCGTRLLTLNLAIATGCGSSDPRRVASVVSLVLVTCRAHSSNACSSSMALSSWSYRRPAALECMHPVNVRSMPAVSSSVDVCNGITVLSVLCIRQRRGMHA